MAGVLLSEIFEKGTAAESARAAAKLFVPTSTHD
jgi:hypothetical protein